MSSTSWLSCLRTGSSKPSIPLPDAKNHLGIMLDYAVNTCHMDIRDIFMRFAYGTVGPAFAMGHPMFVAGMSGGDLARRVLEGTGWPRKQKFH